MLLKKIISCEQTDIGYILHGDTADVALIFMTDDIIRVRVSFDRRFDEASYTLVTTAWPDQMDELLASERTRIEPLHINCKEQEDTLVFSTDTLRLVMRKEPFSMQVFTTDGMLLYEDLRERAFEKDHLGRLFHYSRLDEMNDHFYGFGEKTGNPDKKGKRIRMSPKDAIGHDPQFGDPLYKHIPFYIRIRDDYPHALGLFYHNSFDCVFDMGQEISGYWQRYCYYEADGGDIDLFLLNGPTLKDVLQRYTLLTGRCAMPTKQALGYCASTMYYAELDAHCDEEILRVIDKHEKEKIPIDHFWLASGYSGDEKTRKRYVFSWNRRRFPDPASFFEKMKQRGICVIPNLKPGILNGHPYIRDFEKNHVFIQTPEQDGDYYGRWWGGKGRFFDFTNKNARHVWKEYVKTYILEPGASSIWNDNCEYDGIEDRNAHCSFEGVGAKMDRMKIMHANLMAMTGKQALEELRPRERPHIISRAGFAGIQRYAQVWGGDNLTDWRTLRYNIATIIGMGLSGCPNTGCDIGGFHGPAPEAELLVRWIQNGIFQPRFCINSANNDNTVTQPWMYPECTDIIRNAYQLRYKLTPYLYSLMYEAHQTGTGPMRPLFMEFPDDPQTYTDDSMTFLFGASILVANVLEPKATKRRLYLPSGSRWYDMGDHYKMYMGGQVVEIPVTLSSIPMFLRDSAIVTSSPDICRSTLDVPKRLHLLISAAHDSEFTLYDDDGHSIDYKEGGYLSTHIRVTAGENTTIHFHKEGAYSEQAQHIYIDFVSPLRGAYRVYVNGTLLPCCLIDDVFEHTEDAWFYDAANRIIRIKYSNLSISDYDVVICTSRFDLIGMTEDTDHTVPVKSISTST